MNHKQVVLAVAAASAMVTMGPAFATASASAQITGMKFTLVDLNPADGIAPAMTFLRGAGGASVLGSGADRGESAVFDFSKSGPAFSKLSMQDELEHAGAQARAGATWASASGWTSGAQEAPGPNAFSANAFGTNGAQFTLTPWTALYWTADASIHAETTIGFDLWNFGSESATAIATMVLSGPSPVGAETGGQVSSTTLTTNAMWQQVYDPNTGTYVYTGQSMSQAGKLGASFANLTGDLMTGNAALGVSVSGMSGVFEHGVGLAGVSAVPEPASMALLVPGLVVIGARGRRRRTARTA